MVGVDRKETRSILRYFAVVIEDAAKSLEEIDDEVSELILGAEDSIGRIKDMHGRIYEKSNLKKKYCDGPDYGKSETCEDGICRSVGT